MEVNIFVDGGARGNPGPGAVGVIIKFKVQGSRFKAEENIMQQFAKRIGVVTNNEAEYQAVIEALNKIKNEKLKMKNDKEKLKNFQMINIYLDSKLVYNQLRGFYKVKNSRLRELLFKVRLLEQEVTGRIYYHLIPREENREADKLVNQALSKT